ncbi:TPA: hypothetical protein ACH3X2_012674 [Trebouxia sp. C0005]
MPATPRRKTASQQAQSPAVSLVGRSVAIPLDIFKESDSQYTGKVVGTPKRKKNAVYVKVDQDDTEYWFPADEVAKWVVKDNATAAVPSTPKTPRSRKTALHQNSPSKASTAASNQPARRAERFDRKAVLSMEETALLNTQAHDAASCHPERPEGLAATIEGLATTSAEEIQAITAPAVSVRWLSATGFLVVILLAVMSMQWDPIKQWLSS